MEHPMSQPSSESPGGQETVGLEVFSAPWATAWGEALSQNEAYRQAAAKWEGSILFEMPADPEQGFGEDRAVFLDLHHGQCRAARPATAADREAADFVIYAPVKHWRKLLEGRLEPMWALLSGKLKLRRGSLAKITPYTKASKELLKAAQQLGGNFSELVAQNSAASVRSALAADGATSGAPSTDATNGHGTSNEASPGRVFQTTSSRGLDWNHPAMGLWRKAKRLGIWNPEDLDFTQDREHWQGLDQLERTVILHLTSLFQAGEESVALDLLPLISTIAAEGRLEEEIYLTAFLFEEAKHVEVFRRFVDQVAQEAGDLSRFHGPAYRTIFYEALPQALGQLRDDPSPANQARASVTYNMIVEGVLAETGYHAYGAILRSNQLMPAMQTAVRHLEGDESRHLAYGVLLLSRLVAEHGEPVWEVVEERMQALLPIALEVVEETFAPYPQMPFGLAKEQFTEFAAEQFQRRLRRIEKARRQTLAEVLRRDPAATSMT